MKRVLLILLAILAVEAAGATLLLGMGGMPAFRDLYTEAQTWQLVAFIRYLPDLTEPERAAMAEEAGPHAHTNPHHP